MILVCSTVSVTAIYNTQQNAVMIEGSRSSGTAFI